jgi:hypothetical protein
MEVVAICRERQGEAGRARQHKLGAIENHLCGLDEPKVGFLCVAFSKLPLSGNGRAMKNR